MTYSSDYPSNLEQSLVLKNGIEIFVRPIVPEDGSHIRAALATGDPETLRSRFFTTRPKLSEAKIRHLAEVDYRTRLAVVAFAGTEPVAVARYEGKPGVAEAEFAVVVHPDWRRLGIATALGRILGAAAREQGLARLNAVYMADNRAIARVLDDLGFVAGRVEEGLVWARLDLAA